MDHNGQIESDLIDDGYTAHCSCGWAADTVRTTAAEAERDLAAHYERVQS